MAIWTDLASWRGPTPNRTTGGMVEQRGVVVHIAEGTFEGTISWQLNKDANVSSHFIVAKDGRIAQIVDTSDAAWTQKAGNGHWLSVENEGFTPGALTAQQVDANARLFARWHQVYGGPLTVAVDPNGRGLGHHSMGGTGCTRWDWGHCDCPGPAIINQKPAIAARAAEIIGGDTMPGYAASQPEWADDDIWRGSAMAHGSSTIEGGRYAGSEHWLVARVRAIEAKLDTLSMGGVDVAALAAELAPLLPAPLTADQTEQAAFEGSQRAENE